MQPNSYILPLSLLLLSQTEVTYTIQGKQVESEAHTLHFDLGNVSVGGGGAKTFSSEV